MFSHSTRLFSQEAELSQLECLSNNGVQQQSHEMPDCSQEYDMTRASDDLEDQLSSRALAICEGNRRIRDFVQSSLKQSERRRINLTNKKITINQEIQKYLDINESRRSESINVQMSLEEMATQYQNELEQRSKLLEKVKNVELLITAFQTHYTEGLNTNEEIKKDEIKLKCEFEKIYHQIKTLKSKRSDMNLIFKKDMEQKIIKAQEYNEAIMKSTESCIREVQREASKNMEMKNSLKHLEDKISAVLKRKEELINTHNAISLETKMVSEGVTELRRSLNECRAVAASGHQNLRLQINTEQHNNTNLAAKLKTDEEYYNGLLKQEKENNNLVNQMKIAIENALKDKKEKQLEMEQIEIKKASIRELTNNFAEGIQQCINAEEENNSLKKTIFMLEGDIKSCNVGLKEKEDLVNNLKNQVEESKIILSGLEENEYQLCNALEHSKLVKNDLISKEKEENIVFEQEREGKMAYCNNMEQEKINNASKENEMEVNIVKLREFNDSLKIDIKEIKTSIENYIRVTEESKEKLCVIQEETEKQLKYFKEEIDDNYVTLETFEELLVKTSHKQNEVVLIKDEIETLEQDLLSNIEMFKSEKELLINDFDSKNLEHDREIKNLTSVMEEILNREVEQTEKLTVEIQETEKTEMELDAEIKTLNKQLAYLKKTEANKRDRVVKNEKRLQRINNEIKVTKQDLADAITGNMQRAVTVQPPNKQTHPTYTLDPFKKLNMAWNEPPAKKMDYSTKLVSNFPNEIATRKWAESAVPYDDYDFSEI